MASYHFSIKSGKKGQAANHAAYIAREGKHGKDGKGDDLIAKGHGNLPDWAAHDPRKFWGMADKHERLNGATYREFEVALPGELSTEQQLELAATLIENFVGDKPYQYAVHKPKAAIGGVDQVHLHAMFSDRLSDGVFRTPQRHFMRHNSKHPEIGGCRKDSGGKDRSTLRNEVVGYRATCANLQNSALEKYGHETTVDHRSHRDRGIESPPERHLGPAMIRKMTDVERELFKDNRQRRCG